MKTAVIYARVSSSNDRQDTSRQIEDLKKYAISQDIEIVNIFQEHISGAKKIEERRILGECLEYCKRESVNILLLSELSRLGRSTLQVLRSLDILHESKVSVYIQNLGLYTLQPNGEVNPIASIMVTVLAEMANIERSNIQYRLNSGRANYIAKGGKLGRKTGSTKTDDKKKEAVKLLKDINYTYIDWNCLNNDSVKKYNNSQLLNNLKKTCKGKNTLVILMHDTKDVSNSSNVLKESIQFLKSEGYIFKNFYDIL